MISLIEVMVTLPFFSRHPRMGSRPTTVMFNLRRRPITVNRAAVGVPSEPFHGADSTSPRIRFT
jgi:hypothetical protein